MKQLLFANQSPYNRELWTKPSIQRNEKSVQRGTTTKRLVDMRERPFLCNKGKDQLENHSSEK